MAPCRPEMARAPTKLTPVTYVLLLVNAEHYGRAGANPKEYGNEIHCHVFTFAKFQENTTILSYIHLQ